MSSAAEAELEAAFAGDEDMEDAGEGARLLGGRRDDHSDASSAAVDSSSLSASPAYDFERDRDYDRPPPGDPPAPSPFARPNEYGNSNGFLPQPVVQSAPKPTLFQRIMRRSAQYSPLSQNPVQSGRTVGGGSQNDGVFSNVTAKPSSHSVSIVNPDGNVHIVPEDSFSNKQAPPSYADAQADQAPSYNSVTTTVVVPDGEGGVSGIEETGSIATFFMHAFLSFFFQFIGFAMTHMMAVNHAGRCGSRAGLGATLIQLGLYLRSDRQDSGPGPVASLFAGGEDGTGSGTITDPAGSDTAPMDDMNNGGMSLSPAAREWTSFFLMTCGWFIFLHASVSFGRAKRWERVISQTQQAEPETQLTRADFERDQQVRHNLESVFGLDFSEDHPSRAQTIVDSNGYVVVVPDRAALEEARLARDLRAAGLI